LRFIPSKLDNIEEVFLNEFA